MPKFEVVLTGVRKSPRLYTAIVEVEAEDRKGAVRAAWDADLDWELDPVQELPGEITEKMVSTVSELQEEPCA